MITQKQHELSEVLVSNSQKDLLRDNPVVFYESDFKNVAIRIISPG